MRLVIYHGNCIDGFTAAWAAHCAFADPDEQTDDTEYYAANHGEPPPDVTGRDVLILDFSYRRNVLVEMAETARSIRVIDHHKTAQADLQGLPFVTFDMERSGAGLTWDILHPGRARPWLVNYVEDRDLWRFALDQSKEINAWIGACRRDSFADWNALYHTDKRDLVMRGEAVLSFVDRYVHEMAEQARWLSFEGATVPVVNAPYINTSELVGHLAERAPFAIGWHQRADGKYAYSLRSRGLNGADVSEIAQRYGGGGHRNAAGFQSEFPFDHLSLMKVTP